MGVSDETICYQPLIYNIHINMYIITYKSVYKLNIYDYRYMCECTKR